LNGAGEFATGGPKGDLSKLRLDEATKIRCGERHFEALGVDFDVVTSIDDLRVKN